MLSTVHPWKPNWVKPRATRSDLYTDPALGRGVTGDLLRSSKIFFAVRAKKIDKNTDLGCG